MSALRRFTTLLPPASAFGLRWRSTTSFPDFYSETVDALKQTAEDTVEAIFRRTDCHAAVSTGLAAAGELAGETGRTFVADWSGLATPPKTPKKPYKFRAIKPDSGCPYYAKLNESQPEKPIHSNMLHAAIEHFDGSDSDLNAIRLLLEAGANPNVENAAGKTPLLCAVGSGATELAELLIEFKANVNATDALGYTPLMRAAESRYSKDSMEMLSLLLNNAASQDFYSPSSESAFLLALTGGNYEAAELIHSAAARFPEDERDLALTLAFKQESSECAMLLVKLEILHVTDHIKALAENGWHEVIALGLPEDERTGYDPRMALESATSTGEVETVEWLLNNTTPGVRRDSDNRDGLIDAARNGDEKIVEMLLNSSRPYTLENLNRALMTACYRGHLSIVKKLVEVGAQINRPTRMLDPQLGVTEWTALTIAADAGQTEVVAYLLIRGAGFNDIHDNESPLMAACEKKHSRVVAMLLSAGADPNLRPHPDKASPIEISALRGDIESFFALKAHGAEVTESALCGALLSSSVPIIQSFTDNPKLVTHGVLYAAVGSSDVSASALAAIAELGALVNVLGFDGQTPLSKALRFNKHEQVKALIELAKQQEKPFCITEAHLKTAASHGDLATVLLLLAEKPEIQSSDFLPEETNLKIQLALALYLKSQAPAKTATVFRGSVDGSGLDERFYATDKKEPVV